VIGSNGTWSSCPGADLSAGACPAGGHAGTLVSRGNGLWQVVEGTTVVGTALGFNSAGQNVLLIDLKDTRTSGGLGIGLVVGAQQAMLTTAQTDGLWIAGTSTGNWAVFTASGTTLTLNSVNGIPVGGVGGTFIPNSPWLGVATTNGGGTGFMAGNGVYVLETGNGYAELGVKLR